jgi:hypothetical protein
MEAMLTGQLGADEVRHRIIDRAQAADRRAAAGPALKVKA